MTEWLVLYRRWWRCLILLGLIGATEGAHVEAAGWTMRSPVAGNGCDCASDGPYAPRTVELKRDIPETYEVYSNGLRYLPIKVTYPGPDAAPPGQRPLPVAFLYNGFQLNSGAYDAYASRLASHGVVVLRYDTPFGKILTDTAELPLSQLALEALETQAAAGALPGLEGGRVSEQSPLAAIGHSRGGKFVALQLGAATSTLVDGRGRRRVISAAVMIDPNDSSRFTKDKPGYESGVAALATTALPVLVVGADVIGRCNPDGSNWKEFARAAPAGSWVEVVQGAGHLEFAEVSWAFRLLCPRGTTRPADAIERALAPTVAAVLRGVADVAPEACGLWDWVARETEAGTITWSETKDGGAPEGGHAVRVADGRQGIDAGEPASAK